MLFYSILFLVASLAIIIKWRTEGHTTAAEAETRTRDAIRAPWRHIFKSRGRLSISQVGQPKCFGARH